MKSSQLSLCLFSFHVFITRTNKRSETWSKISTIMSDFMLINLTDCCGKVEERRRNEAWKWDYQEAILTGFGKFPISTRDEFKQNVTSTFVANFLFFLSFRVKAFLKFIRKALEKICMKNKFSSNHSLNYFCS